MKRYPKEVKDFIRDNVAGRSAKELVTLVNAEFDIGFTESKMNLFKSNNKLKSGTPGGLPAGTSNVYSPEVQRFIRNNVTGRTVKELAECINSMFGTAYTAAQMRAYKKNHNLISGLDFCFPKGHVPPNKGKKGYYSPGCEKGWFPKGHTPHDQVPLGTEILRDGRYLWVKVAEPNRWKQKHRIIWETANGAIPRDHCLLFGDGDQRNITLDNLILITRSQLATLNRFALIHNNVDLTKTGIVIADIQHRLNARKKEGT